MEQFRAITEELNRHEVFSYMPRVGVADIIEILLIAFSMYYIIKTVQGTRAWVIIKGVAILFVFYILAYALQLTVIVSIFESIILFIGIAIVIIMQQDIRKLIEMIGSRDINITINGLISSVFKKHENVNYRLTDSTIQEIVKGCFIMSKAKTGALIVIEKNIPLREYAESGIAVNADITSQLLINIFEHNTPLHDGAVIIQNNRITAATCYLPLSENKKINKDLGTRHRAGIGMTEETDSLVVIVSEETGSVSVSRGGELLHNIDRETLAEELRNIQKIYDKSDGKSKRALLSNNFAMKLASLCGSIALWLLVITAVNPIETITFRDIEVQLVNKDALSEVGKTFELVGDNKINVTVKNRKDILDKIDESDVYAVADMSKLSYVNSVPIEVMINGYDGDDIKLSEQVIKISIEDVITTEFDIEINTIGEVNERYYISGIELQNNSLIISGAESVVSTIGSVQVDIDESKFTTNTMLEIEPKIYDKNGELLDKSKFTLNNDTIKANIYLYNTKTIPLIIKTEVKDNAVGKIVSNIECQEKFVTVTGPDEVLSQYNAINITVPLELTMSDITTGQFIKNISLQSYLKDGLIATQQSSKANIIVEFKPFTKGTLQLSSSDIMIDNANDNLKYSIENTDFNITYFSTIQGNTDLTVEKAMPYLDVKDLDVGEHDVSINFRRMGTNMFEEKTVKVTIENNG